MTKEKKSSSAGSKKKEEKLDSHKIRPDNDEEEQPTWFHYFIIFGIVILVFLGIWFVFETFSAYQEPDRDAIADPEDTYVYEYVRGNVTYNIELSAPLDELRKYDFMIEPSREEIMNTVSFTFSFDEYEGSDNGQVSLGAIKLSRFLSRVYSYSFDEESFVLTEDVNCDDASSAHKVVMFDPRSDESGVFREGEGCYVVAAQTPNLLPFVVDVFILEIIGE